MNSLLNLPIVLVGVSFLVFSDGSSVNAQSNENSQPSFFNQKQVLSDRDRRFIESTAGRDFDQLVEAISLPDGENSLIVYWSAMQPSLTGGRSVPFRAVLEDLRVAKLYELLAAMPRDEASRRILQIYEDKFERFTTKWGKVMEGGGGRSPSDAKHGLAATLFLCLEFCGDDQLDQGLQQWADWLKANQGKSREFMECASPDELMVINFYAVALNKKGVPLKELNQRVQQLCDEVGSGRLPDLRIQQFYKWNAGVNMQVDPDEVLGEYPVFFNWGNATELSPLNSATLAIRTSAMAKARDWIRLPGPFEQWLEFVWQRLAEWANSWLQLE